MLFKIALRNLMVNKRRNLMVAITVAAASLTLVLALGFYAGVREQIITGAITVQTGAAHLYAGPTAKENLPYPAFETPNWANNLTWPDHPFWAKLMADPRVAVINPRIYFDAMLAGNGQPLSLRVTAIDPGREKSLFKVLPPQAGTVLPVDEPYAIYISQTYARKLQVGPGDTLQLTANTASNQFNVISLTVAGIFKKNAPWYEYYAFIPLETAQELLDFPGRVLEANISLKKSSSLPAFVNDWAPRVPALAKNARLESWEKSEGIFLTIIKGNLVIGVIINLVLLIVVMTILHNAILLTLRERLGEIGIIKAMGMANSDLFHLYVCEYAILTTGAALAGAILGEALLLCGSAGINIGKFEAMSWAIGGELLRLQPSLTALAIAVATIIFSSVAAAALPIRKYVKKSPAAIFRFVK